MNAKNVCYDEITAKKYVSEQVPIYNVSSEIEVQYRWVNGKRTDEIIGYKMFFAQEGVNPFFVKFLTKPQLPKFLAEVVLEQLEAVEVKTQVYFRAKNVKGKE